MPRIYFSSCQQGSFSSGPGSSQICSLTQTSVNAEFFRNTNQGGVVQILILTMLLFVAFRWWTQKRNENSKH